MIRTAPSSFVRLEGSRFSQVEESTKKQARFRVIYEVMYVVGLEIVENRHCHDAVGNRGNGGDSPVGAVSSAQGYLVARFQSGIFKKQMQFGNFACDVAVLERLSLKVGHGGETPVVADGLLDV